MLNPSFFMTVWKRIVNLEIEVYLSIELNLKRIDFTANNN
jgi:hypothetical protein